MAKFIIENEVTNHLEDGWKLYFQYGTYVYDKNNSEQGFRFIWRDPEGKLQPARGQARIPSKKDIFELLALASKEKWF